jgi:hypothetical protein
LLQTRNQKEQKCRYKKGAKDLTFEPNLNRNQIRKRGRLVTRIRRPLVIEIQPGSWQLLWQGWTWMWMGRIHMVTTTMKAREYISLTDIHYNF